MLDTSVSERHTLSILVDNEPGVLARVVGLFSGRGYNIESLTVSEVDEARHQSRISVVTSGTPIVPVHSVQDLTIGPAHVERELALVKTLNTGNKRVEALRVADSFRARTLDSTLNSFVFEVTGNSSKVTAFIELMSSLGDVEVARTGVCGMTRGNKIDMSS